MNRIISSVTRAGSALCLCCRLFVFLLAAFALQGCTQPRPLIYREVKHFRAEVLSLQQTKIILGVQYVNPNPYALKLKDGNIDVYVNGTYLGKASLDEQIAVPAQSEFIIPVEIALDMNKVLNNAPDLLSSDEVTIKIRGTVKAGRNVFITVPVDHITKQRIGTR